MADRTSDDAAATPPRDTYMPKPPSKPEVDQVSREQGMVADEWAPEPPAGGKDQPAGGGEGPDGGRG